MSAPAGTEAGYRACLRDLVALSVTPVWWIGRSVGEIADGVRDMLGRMLRTDGVYVRVLDPNTKQRIVSAAGVHARDFEAALDAAEHEDDHIEQLGGAGPRIASVLIGLQGRQGRIAVASERPDFPTEHERLVLRVAANQVSIAIEHAALLARHERLERQFSERAEAEAAIARLGMRALAGTSHAHLLRRALRIIVQRIPGIDAAYVAEQTPDGRAYEFIATAGIRSGAPRLVPAERAPQLAYTLTVRGRVVVADLRRETRFDPDGFLLDEGLASGMTVPIHDRFGASAVLGAHARVERDYAAHELHLLQSVANLIGAARQRVQADREFERMIARTVESQRQAEWAARTNSNFLALISHELRTPLGAISGYVDLMSLELHGPVTDAQREDLERIRRSQRYLVSLIDNVLSYLRLGSGQIRYRADEFDFDECVRAVDEMVLPQIEAKHLRYECDGPHGVKIRADRDKLLQILLNLASNAIKYTDPGGTVRIEWGVDADTVRVEIRDTGRGIPEDRIESVFDPYVRVESGGAPEGTGLGLAISRAFARGMGGDIVARSRLGAGSAFTLFLPLHGPGRELATESGSG